MSLEQEHLDFEQRAERAYLTNTLPKLFARFGLGLGESANFDHVALPETLQTLFGNDLVPLVSITSEVDEQVGRYNSIEIYEKSVPKEERLRYSTLPKHGRHQPRAVKAFYPGTGEAQDPSLEELRDLHSLVFDLLKPEHRQNRVANAIFRVTQRAR